MSDEKKDVWVRLPLDVLNEQGMSKAAAVVLAVIVDRCTSNVDRCAAITTKYIVSSSGYSRATVYDALKELFRLDLIAHERTGRASRYRLTRCVELYPNACEVKESAQKKAARKQRREDRKDLEEYAKLANRFKNEEEPIEGQMEFTQPEEAPAPDPVPEISPEEVQAKFEAWMERNGAICRSARQ